MEVATVPSKISAGIEIPIRSRSFTPDEVKAVLTALQNGQNVGYGVFSNQQSARNAGMTLNKLLVAHGAPHKYATTVYQLENAEDGSECWQGAVKPQQAKAAPAKGRTAKKDKSK